MKKITIVSFAVLIFLPELGAEEDPYLVRNFRLHKDQVQSVDFSYDGEYLASGADDKTLYIISLNTGEVVREYSENYFPVKDIEFTKENNLFITAGSDIKLINLENQTLKLFKGNSTHIWSLDYAPERNKLSAGSFDFKIKVWDVPTEKMVLVLEGHKKSTLPVCFSPDEKYIVSGSLDRTIKVWNALTGENLKTLERHSENIYDIEFHPNGKYFASASLDKTIRLWNIQTGNVVKTYSGHEKGILDIEFTPDGEHFVSASYDGTIILWQTRTAEKVYSFIEHEGAVHTIALSKDGNYMASGGEDHKLMLWKLGKRIYVENTLPEVFETKLGSIPLAGPKRKGESNKDFEARRQEAEKNIEEMSEELYKTYYLNLKKTKIE